MFKTIAGTFGAIGGSLIGLFLPKPKVEIDIDGLVDFLVEYMEVDDLQASFDALRREFRVNPFKPSDIGVWGVVRQNIDLIQDAVLGFVQCLERVTIGGQELQAPEKLEIAAEALDRLIQLPWYLEPFDKPLLKLVISIGVSLMNTVGWQPVGRITEIQDAAPVATISLHKSKEGTWDVYQ